MTATIPDKLSALFTELMFVIFKSSLTILSPSLGTSKKIPKSPRKMKALDDHFHYDCIPSLAVKILCDVFASAKSQRGYILQDLFSFTVFCNNQKLASKTPVTTLFGSHSSYGCDLTITPSTAIAIALVQSVTVYEKYGQQSNATPVHDAETLSTETKEILAQSNSTASYVMAELTRRCRNKDTGSEYRKALNTFVSDLLNVQSLLNIPSASLLLTTFVRRSTLDISEGIASPASEMKNDLSYVMFLVDILGGVGSRLQEIVVKFSGEYQGSFDETTTTMLRNTWSVLNVESKLALETAQVPQRASRSKKNSAKKIPPVILAAPLISIEETLFAYSVLANVVLEAKCDQVANQNDSRLVEVKVKLDFDNEVDEKETNDPLLEAEVKDPKIIRQFLDVEHFKVPPFRTLLLACGVSEEKCKRFSDVSPADLFHYCLLNFLVSQLDLSLNQVSSSNLLFGSIVSNSALWMMNNLKSGQSAAAANTFQIITHLCKLVQQSDSKSPSFGLLEGHKLRPTLSFSSFEWASHCNMLILLNSRFLHSDFSAIQKSLLNLFSHPSPLVRSRVVRSLNLLVKVDSSLFENKSIKESVLERFNDVAISVREEVVKLVGGYLLEPQHDVSYSDTYLSGLLIRLRDKGVSVRKSVVQILRDILLHQPHHPRYSEICLRLLERSMNPKEEDSLKDIVQQTFQQVWFNPAPNAAVESTGSWSVLSTPQRQRKQASTLGSISPMKFPTEQIRGTPSSEAKSRFLHAEATALQIVDVVYFSVSNGGDEEWLVKLIRDVLHGSTSGCEVNSQAKKRQNTSLTHCEKLIDCLLNMLLSCELALKEGCPTDGVRTPQETIVALFVTFSCFCKAHPPYVVRHIHTLLPYLKGENGLSLQQDSILCYHLIQMLSITLEIPLSTSSLQQDIEEEGGSLLGPLAVTQLGVWESRVDEISADLTRIALNYPVMTIQPAVECLSQLATHVCRHGHHILALAQKCFDSIFALARSFPLNDAFAPGINKFDLSSSQISRIQRSIVVLGSICEQSNKCIYLQDTSPEGSQDHIISKMCLSEKKGDLNSLRENALNGCCYVCVKFCLSLDIEAIQARAAQALCSVFVGRPNLIISAESDGILGWLLGTCSRTSASVISKTLQSLNNVLIEEERRLELGAAVLDIMKQSNTPIGKRVQGKDVGSDGTVTGNILRNHLTLLTNLMTMSPEPLIRLNGLKLIGTLLGHGMVHPMDVFSLLIGMQGDDDEVIRQTALALIVEQDEKCSNFLDNRILDGLECAFRIQKFRLGDTFPFLASVSDSDAAVLCSLGGTSCQGVQLPASKSCTSLISSLYATCFRGNKKRRMDFLVGLLRRCEIHCHSIASARERIIPSLSLQSSALGEILQSQVKSDSTRSDLEQPLNKDLLETSLRRFELTSFLCAVLSSLPFCWADEPLSAIYWISRNSNVSASLFEKLFRSCLKQSCATEYDASSSDSQHPKSKKPAPVPVEIDPTLQGYDDQLLVLQTMISVTSSSDQQLGSEIFILSLLAVEGGCRSVLMRLKCFLKSVFSFSDDRCLSFTPSYDKEVSDSAHQRSAQLPLSDKDRDFHRSSWFSPLPSYLESFFSNAGRYVRSLFPEGCEIASEINLQLSKQQEEEFLKFCLKIYNCQYALVHGDGNDLTLVPKKCGAKREGNKKQTKPKAVRKSTPQKNSKAAAAAPTPTPPRTQKRKRLTPTRYGDSAAQSPESDEEFQELADSDYEG
jgi:hypothetical protein